MKTNEALAPFINEYTKLYESLYEAHRSEKDLMEKYNALRVRSVYARSINNYSYNNHSKFPWDTFFIPGESFPERAKSIRINEQDIVELRRDRETETGRDKHDEASGCRAHARTERARQDWKFACECAETASGNRAEKQAASRQRRVGLFLNVSLRCLTRVFRCTACSFAHVYKYRKDSHQNSV